MWSAETYVTFQVININTSGQGQNWRSTVKCGECHQGSQKRDRSGHQDQYSLCCCVRKFVKFPEIAVVVYSDQIVGISVVKEILADYTPSLTGYLVRHHWLLLLSAQELVASITLANSIPDLTRHSRLV